MEPLRSAVSAGKSDCEKLDIAMLSLWQLGIIALHEVGSGRGDGVRACRKIYQDAGGPESGYLGFCYYRRADVEAGHRAGCVEIVCGDFLDKNLVTRKVQEVIRDSLRAAGLDATAKRGTSNRILLRSLRGERRAPPPTPPFDVTPQPPAALIASTTAVPAPSVPHKRNLLTPGVIPESPLEKLRNMALGMGAAPPIPGAPGVRMPGSEEGLPGAPRRKRSPPARLTRGSKRAVGIGLSTAGLILIVLLRDTPRTWLGGVAFLVLGLVLVALGRARERP